MANIDRAYVSVAFILLIVGLLLGLYMGASGSNTYLSVHIALVLPGFVILAIYGALYRLWPQLKTSRLATAQFWLTNAGALGVIVGTLIFIRTGGADITIVASGSGLYILGAMLLAFMFWTAKD